MVTQAPTARRLRSAARAACGRTWAKRRPGAVRAKPKDHICLRPASRLFCFCGLALSEAPAVGKRVLRPKQGCTPVPRRPTAGSQRRQATGPQPQNLGPGPGRRQVFISKQDGGGCARCTQVGAGGGRCGVAGMCCDVRAETWCVAGGLFSFKRSQRGSSASQQAKPFATRLQPQGRAQDSKQNQTHQR